MASGTINGTTNNQNIICKIEWESTKSKSTPNKSFVTAKLYYKRTNTGYATLGTGTFSISIGFETLTEDIDIQIRTDWVLAMSRTLSVAHNIDGTKSITISASGNIPGTSLAATYCSGTVTLDTISRPTIMQGLTCSTSYLTGLFSYYFTPLSNYYSKSNISLNIDGTYIHIRSILHGKATPGVTLTQSFRFTSSELSLIYKNLPTTIGGKIRVTMRTYKDSNYSSQYEDAYHDEIYLDIPLSIVPTANLSLQANNENNAWIKEKGICVAGYSGLQLSLDGEAGEGASIVSQSIRGGGYSSNSNTLYIDTILDDGKITFTGSITDSRGVSVAEATSVNVEPYSIPAIRGLTVSRGTYSPDQRSWTADDNGPDVGVFFKTSLALTNYSNTYDVTFTWDGVEKSPIDGKQTSLTSGTEYAFYFINLDGENSYALRVLATDRVGESGSATITVPTTFITMEFNDSGKGIAFGKTSEKDAFECAMDSEFSGTLVKRRSDGTLVEFDDTGWISLGTSDAVSATDASDTGRNGVGCYYRVINGNHVYVAFNVSFTFSGDAVRVNANNIPSALRPSRKAYAMCPVSGRSYARIGANTSGDVVVDWIQDVDSAAETTYASTLWIDGYIDYWI